MWRVIQMSSSAIGHPDMCARERTVLATSSCMHLEMSYTVARREDLQGTSRPRGSLTAEVVPALRRDGRPVNRCSDALPPASRSQDAMQVLYRTRSYIHYSIRTGRSLSTCVSKHQQHARARPFSSKRSIECEHCSHSISLQPDCRSP